MLPLIPTDAVSLINNSLVRLVNYILNDVVGADGTLGINKIVNNLTDNSGIVQLTLKKLTDIFDYFGVSIPTEVTFPLTKFTNMTIGFSSLGVAGLNTWKNLTFFAPVGENALNVWDSFLN